MARNSVPSFTRRDFQYLADVIRTIDFDCAQDRDRVVNEFTDALRATNPQFRPETFRAACTVKGVSRG